MPEMSRSGGGSVDRRVARPTEDCRPLLAFVGVVGIVALNMDGESTADSTAWEAAMKAAHDIDEMQDTVTDIDPVISACGTLARLLRRLTSTRTRLMVPIQSRTCERAVPTLRRALFVMRSVRADLGSRCRQAVRRSGKKDRGSQALPDTGGMSPRPGRAPSRGEIGTRSQGRITPP